MSESRAGGLDTAQVAALVRNLRCEVPTDAPDVEPEDAALALEACIREVEALRTALRWTLPHARTVVLGAANVYPAALIELERAEVLVGAPERDLKNTSREAPQP